jgi:hypothetical protein
MIRLQLLKSSPPQEKTTIVGIRKLPLVRPPTQIFWPIQVLDLKLHRAVKSLFAHAEAM